MAATKRKPRIRDRVFRVYLDKRRNRFVAVDDNGDLLGVSTDKDNAIGSAVREANMASRAGYQVIVMVENSNGSFKKEYVAAGKKA